MQDRTQSQILGAVLIAFRPIARILLRFGIGFREFAELAKTAFVDVASKDFGLRGRPTNISRVAVMTGLTRKEVRRIREKIEAGDEFVVVKSTPLSTILHHWHADDEFLDAEGRPKKLRFAGEEGSFSNLVKRYGGDIPPGAMRTELKRVGAIKEVNGLLEVVGRTLHPSGFDNKLITAFVHGLYPLAATMSHNLDPNRDNIWAQLSTYSKSIRARDVPRLRRIGYDRLTDVAKSLDDLFIAYEALHENEADSSDNRTVVVGLYYFEEGDDDSEAFFN